MKCINLHLPPLFSTEKRRAFFLFLTILVGPGLVLANETTVGLGKETLEGRWEGAMLFKAGQIELDMVARFARGPEDTWSATLDVPIIDIRNQVLEDIEVDGKMFRLKIQLDPGAGGGGYIVGQMAADGQSIEGSFDRANGQSSQVILERKAASEPKLVEVLDLAPGIEDLRERFNADQEAVRLVLLLSPS